MDPIEIGLVPIPPRGRGMEETRMHNDTTFVGTDTFQVSGMTCEHCRRAVTDEIGRLAGVSAVDVDLDSGVVTVTATEPVERAAVAAAVDEAGYALLP
jgi:copper ion binding protein